MLITPPSFDWYKSAVCLLTDLGVQQTAFSKHDTDFTLIHAVHIHPMLQNVCMSQQEMELRYWICANLGLKSKVQLY